MKKQLLLLTCFVIFVLFAHSQPVNSIIGDVVMPAPTAAALGEYSDVPVDYYSGLPNISIPIYTLREGSLSLPISLSYHASGIRAAEMASWVGLGWSLNAGGIITRTTLGIRDEDGAKGYYTQGASLNTDAIHVSEVAEGLRDGEPDIFSFNVGGYTGKFIFDDDNNPFLIPKQDIKIVPEFVGNQFKSFTIITPNGVKYLFGSEGMIDAIEKSKVTNVFPEEPNFEASSWYLIKITSADGNYNINLEYEDENYSFKNVGSCSKIEYTCTTGSGVNGGEMQSCQGVEDANLPTPYNHIPFTINNIEGKRLKKISCSTSVVEFTATNNREDIDQAGMNLAKCLDKITIKPGGTSTSFCTDWEFDYEYFTDGLNLSGSLSKRLKLKSIQQKSCINSDASNPNPYYFTYNSIDNSDNTQFLPNRLTKAIDHWGYYNGVTSNDNNVPFSDQINIPSTTVITGDGVSTSMGKVTERHTKHL